MAIAVCATLGLSYVLLSSDPWWFIRWLRGDAARALQHGVSDKLYHVLGYLTLTLTFMWWAVSRSQKAVLLLGTAAALHAVVTELLQHFVPGRTVDRADFVANLAGVTCGVCFGLVLRRVRLTASEDSAPAPVTPQRQLGGIMKTSQQAVSQVDSTAGLSRSAITSDEAAEIRPRMINYRFVAILAVAFGVFFSSVFAIHGWQMQRNAGALIELGERARDEGDLNKAREYFNRYVGMVPTDSNALATLGMLLDDSAAGPGALRQVFAIYEDVLRADPSREDIRRRQITTAMAIGRYSDALAHVTILRQVYSTDGELALLAADCQREMGQSDAAVESYEQAIEFSPRLIEAWAGLADLSYEVLDQQDRASELLDRLVEQNSSVPTAWLERAKFRQRTGELDAAADDMREAISRDSENVEVLLAATELGYARIAAARTRGQTPKAQRLLHQVRSQLDRAVELAPERLNLRLHSILIESHFGDQQQAMQELNELLADQPGDHRAHLLLADLTVERGDFDKAREALDLLPRTPVSDSMRLFLQGRISMSQKNWRQALSEFIEARRFQVDVPEMLERTDLAIASCYRELNETDAELGTLRQIMKYQPNSVPGRLALASSLLRQQKLQAAIAEYRPLSALPQVRLLLARLLILQNLQLPEVAREWREAESLLEEATQQGSDPTQVVLLQAELLAARQRFAAAEQLLTEARTSQADRLEFLVALAKLAEQAGDQRHATLWMGQALAAAGNVADAEQQLQQALKLAPDDATAARTLMELYIAAGRTDEAITMFRQHAPKMTTTELAQTYALFGDHARAAELFERESTRESVDLKALDGLASVYLQSQMLPQAESLLERLVREADATTSIGQTARRRLALLLSGHSNYASRQRALKLLDENMTSMSQPTVEDLRVKSAVLASSPLTDDRNQAIDVLEILDDQNQLLPRDRWLLGRLYQSAGRLGESTSQFEQSLSDGEVSERLLADYVEHLVEYGDRDAAEHWLQRLRSQYPAATDLLRLEARLALKHGQSTEAITLLKSFVAMSDSSSAQADRLVHAAAIADAISTGDERSPELDATALDFLFAAVELEPQHVGQLVVWQLNNGRDVEAFERLDDVWQHLDAETAAGVSMAMLSAGPTRDRTARIESKLEQSVKQQPKQLLIKVCLADVKSLQEQYTEAETLYRQVLHVEPRHVPALNNLAWLLGMQDREIDEAMSLIERAIEIAGPGAQLLDTRACVLLAQGRTRNAIADLQQSIADGEVTPTMLLHLAVAQLDHRDMEAARTAFEQAQAAGLNESRLHPLDRQLFKRVRDALQSELPVIGSDV
jgi:tetratricopeptide (TPR) repeat protein